jgi:hypothetical protein
VNEDDEKLKNFTVEEKDQGSILVIGGIEVFLQHSQIEVIECVADATDGQQAETTMEKEEQILKSVPHRRGMPNWITHPMGNGVKGTRGLVR